MISIHSQDQIVLQTVFGEIFFRVIDDMVCPERAHHFQVSSAADGRHFSHECFCYLDGNFCATARSG